MFVFLGLHQTATVNLTSVVCPVGLFGRCLTKSFIVQSSESIEMVYENETYTTNMTLQQNKWNKVVVMYYGELGEFDIYIFNTLFLVYSQMFVFLGLHQTATVNLTSVVCPVGLFGRCLLQYLVLVVSSKPRSYLFVH
jgi:hypothetical protein